MCEQNLSKKIPVEEKMFILFTPIQIDSGCRDIDGVIQWKHL